MNTLEFYQQTYTCDIGNNLTNLIHQANSSVWQQTLSIHPNSNRGTETQQPTSNFDANGNLLVLDNIGTLHWHHNNTLNQFSKADKSNTLHIGTHILSETSKNNAQNPNQTLCQLTSHLQSNTLELDDKAQTLSYEHYYPYGGSTLIAGKDKTQVQQKRYRYTGKERDDSSGLSYYGARYLAPWLARWISPDSAGAIDGLNLYVYVSNSPLKYRDPTGHVKVSPANKGKPYELDILSPIEGTYQNNNLFHFPEAYERLENIVKAYPADKFNLIDANTKFTIESEYSSNRALIIKAYSHPPSDYFVNIMNFSTGELIFHSHLKNEDINRHSGLNATEITAYQYLGMTKIAGALNILPKTILNETIINDSTNETIKIYKADINYPRFYRNFLIKSDNGRFSLRVANTFSLEITSIKLKRAGSDIRLHLKPKMPLISVEEPLPPRGDMHEYFAPTTRIRRRINHCTIL
ncbi:hypothetical protein [uncultured Gammaproteobacteria bacterium]|nr:hypothetical protein [uncultured Gammaproteobacteria bacterium]